MIRGSLPLVSKVTADNFREILSMGTSALIAYVDEGDQKSRAVFTAFAELHQNDFIYGIASDPALAESNVQKAPFIIIYNPRDQVNPIFKETFSLDKLKAFTGKHSTPLIGTFSLETYYAYTEVLTYLIPWHSLHLD
jgi:protein disulfide-isomerase A1